MNSIPSSVLAIIQLYLTALLHWFSAEVYERQLGRVQNHFLVRLNKSLEFGPLEKACVDFHHPSGAGAPPIHTVPLLVRALLVKQLWFFGQIDSIGAEIDGYLRQTCNICRCHLLFSRQH